MAEARFHVPEIHCDGCVATIRKSVSALTGIAAVGAEVEKRLISVDYDEGQTSPNAIRERIERAGFDVE
jgi:copper chaperone CopZ